MRYVNTPHLIDLFFSSKLGINIKMTYNISKYLTSRSVVFYFKSIKSTNILLYNPLPVHKWLLLLILMELIHHSADVDWIEVFNARNGTVIIRKGVSKVMAFCETIEKYLPVENLVVPFLQPLTSTQYQGNSRKVIMGSKRFPVLRLQW